jgi:RND family efflux transporter MFP subunit
MMGGFSPGSAGGVVTLVDFSRVKIRVEVSGADIGRIQKGQTAILRVPTNPGQEFKGTVSVVNLAADPQTKKFGIEVRVDNPDQVLRPGTFGEVVIEVLSHEDALVIPQKAVLENKYVFLAQNGKAARKEITLGLQNTTMVEVTSGIAEGDLVIAEGNFGLEEGAPIEVSGEV